MDIFMMITIGGVGFALGMYVSSQIMQSIDSNRRHKKFMKNIERHDMYSNKGDMKVDDEK